MTNQSIANVVIAVLNEIDVDGEMMEHIINQVNMRDQMIKQLVTNKQELDSPIVASFTKNALIEYTCTIQERFKTAAIESITNAGIDFEDMVELELDHNKTISVHFDENTLRSEIESAIDEAFEMDDEYIWIEATNVITYMSKR
jgi:hypothetical protein